MNILDRVIGFFSPEAGVRRAAARASLQQINQLIGTPNGPYAAANRHRLNARNRIVIVIPCHRVIGGDGSLTGFAAGLARKQALLRLEGALPRPLL